MEDERARAAISRMLGEPLTLVFHNAKFDLQKLILAGVMERSQLSAERLIDTECLSQLVDEHRQKKLKVLARDLLGLSTNEDEVLKKVRKKLKLNKDSGYHLLPRNVLVPYAIKDADFTIRVFRYLWPLVERDDQLYRLFGSEMELLLAVLDIEAAGNGLDLDYLRRTTKEVRTNVLRCELRIAETTGLKVFYPEKKGQKTPEGFINLNSHVQVLEALAQRNARVSDTRGETLKQLDDPLAISILELRGEKKLLDYLVAMETERRDNIIHPNFRLFKPVTGRMASGKVEE